MMKFGIGQPIARVEDLRFLTGNGRYTDDIRLPGELHACVLRSAHAHASIGTIDASRARNVRGVEAVFVAADIGDDLGGLPCNKPAPLRRPDGSPMFEPQRRVMAIDRVRYVGEPVAMVVATSEAAARDALELIRVDFTELAAVGSVLDATKAGAPRVWDQCLDNVAVLHSAGDAAAVTEAIRKADCRIEFEHRISRVAGTPLEPRSAVAHYEPADDHSVLITGNQSPHDLRRILADSVLKIPQSKLSVVSPDLGGGFGVRGSIYPEFALLLWATKRLRRPIRWTADRSECFLCEDHGRDSAWRVTLALDADGIFTGLGVDVVAALGAYIGLNGPVQAIVNVGGVAGPYRTPAISAAIRGVFTNTPPISPYRGAGRPEASYAVERAIDLAAAKIGMDRLEIRRRNMIPPSALPFQTGLTFRYDCGRFEEVMNSAAVLADYRGFSERRRESRSRDRLRGFGIANAIEQAGRGYEEYARIRIESDGSAVVLVGTCSHGQGHETIFRQVVAERLGLDFDRIQIVQGDTRKVSYGHGTFGSRSTGSGGAALFQAADRILEKGRSIAAHHLEAAPTDIEFAKGHFKVSGTDRAVSFKDVAKLSFALRALPSGIEPGLEASGIFVPPAPTFPNATHTCEVEIDPETGQLQILRYSVVDDVGTVVNPLLLEGQIHGGIAQGAGQVLMEQIVFDGSSCQLMTGSFMDYAMPRASDFPSFVVESKPVPTSVNPLGVKGAGEAGTVGALPCVMSAILDALKPLGILTLEMPATSERVWRAIRSAKKI